MGGLDAHRAFASGENGRARHCGAGLLSRCILRPRHRQGERDALAACLEAGVPAGVLKDATRQALDAYWGLLDGVCQETGIEA